MAKINLKLLNLSDFKVTPAQQKQSYVFIMANGQTISDPQNAQATFLNRPNSGFANLIRKFTINKDQAN